MFGRARSHGRTPIACEQMLPKQMSVVESVQGIILVPKRTVGTIGLANCPLPRRRAKAHCLSTLRH